MLHQNIETFIGCESSYADADIVLYGAPFDSTTSYRPGARFGPAAMRHESYGLETYSPYQDKDLTDIKVFDSGDMELCFGSSESALKDIEARAETILQDGKFPLLLGGEHLVTLGAVRAAAHKYPAMHIIHFDAHADLRQDYLGAELSHACVLRRCHDILGDGRIHQFCIRSGDREEFMFAKTHTEMHKFDFSGLEALAAELCRTQVPVYLTIDLDCLDPSCFPGTGTPEAGGVTFMQLLNAILTVSKTNIIGADVNELAPMLDASGVSTAMACKVLREVSAPGSYWENGHWVEIPAMSIKRAYTFDQVGQKDMYLLHHEEIESLGKNLPEVKRIRFFMTFGQSYLDHMRCLEDVGMLSTTPIHYNGQEIVPIQFLKALLPDPASLGPRTKGKTNIGCIFTGKKDGKEKTYYIYNVCDHQECYREVGSQAISYTTGVPAMCGALMMLTGKWTKPGVYTVEEFDPDPFLDALDKYGLPRSENHDPALVD